MKYRKKPIIIEATQWFEPGHPQHDPSLLVVRLGNQVDPPDYRRTGDFYCAMPEGRYGLGGSAVYMIRTLEGDLKVSDGDWIITGIAGEKYPCKPDIFEATYERVDDL